MDRNHAKSVALFFYLSLLDEDASFEASKRAYKKILRRLKKSNNKKNDMASVLVHATNYYWKRFSKVKSKKWAHTEIDSGWQIPQDVDFSSWKEFVRESEPEELLILIWNRVLNISEDEIALGIGVSQGTVRYRLGKALRKLGYFAQPGVYTL